MSEVLMICGSKDASPEMVEYAERCVLRAKARGWRIAVGDALGVDKAVVDACQKHGVVYRCYGIREKPINGAFSYIQINLDRDEKCDLYMMEQAHHVMCIWNSESLGTYKNYQVARREMKVPWLYIVGYWYHPESDSLFYGGMLSDDASRNGIDSVTEKQAQDLSARLNIPIERSTGSK